MCIFYNFKCFIFITESESLPISHATQCSNEDTANLFVQGGSQNRTEPILLFVNISHSGLVFSVNGSHDFA